MPLERYHLSKESSLEDIARAVCIEYYLPPYPNRQAKEDDVNRRWQGGVHACRVALNAQMLLALYEKFLPHMVPKLSEDEKKLLYLAALYHDSANTGEIFHNEKMHADNFRRDMLQLGYSKDLIALFADAIEHKDNEDYSSFYKKIIHDADCLDLLRMILIEDFTIAELFIWQDLSRHGKIESKQYFQEIIVHHKKVTEKFDSREDYKSERELKIACEKSEHCFLSIKKAMIQIFFSTVIIDTIKAHGYIVDDIFHHQNIDILDLYHPPSSKLYKSIKKFKPLPKDAHNHVLKLYQSTGLYVRCIKKPYFELQTLAENKQVLQNEKISSSQQLRSYILTQTDQNKALAPNKFKWRPASWLGASTQTELFFQTELLFDAIGVLIASDKDSTKGCFFYKKNVSSRNTAQGDNYNRMAGIKDKNHIGNLQEKLKEMEARRRGIEKDYNFHYWGREILPWTEVLLHYGPNSVIGLLVKPTKFSIEIAMLLMSLFGKALPLFVL